LSSDAFTAPAAGPVENDPVQRSEAKIAHLLGIFGIIGTGVYYLVKRTTAGPFTLSQMKEAFNFQLAVFAAAIALMIVGVIAAIVIGPLAILFSLASMALMIGDIVLSIVNALKAGNGHAVRYPFRINVLK
jgi:uncharacterized Tic20 family protein